MPRAWRAARGLRAPVRQSGAQNGRFTAEASVAGSCRAGSRQAGRQGVLARPFGQFAQCSGFGNTRHECMVWKGARAPSRNRQDGQRRQTDGVIEGGSTMITITARSPAGAGSADGTPGIHPMPPKLLTIPIPVAGTYVGTQKLGTAEWNPQRPGPAGMTRDRPHGKQLGGAGRASSG